MVFMQEELGECARGGDRASSSTAYCRIYLSRRAPLTGIQAHTSPRPSAGLLPYPSRKHRRFLALATGLGCRLTYESLTKPPSPGYIHAYRRRLLASPYKYAASPLCCRCSPMCHRLRCSSSQPPRELRHALDLATASVATGMHDRYVTSKTRTSLSLCDVHIFRCRSRVCNVVKEATRGREVARS